MTKGIGFPENLTVRARRGALSCDEQREFEQLLSSSAAIRTAYAVGQDFDGVDTVQPGDEARIEHFVASALRARHLRSARGVPRRISWLLAAAVFGFCGLAFGLRGVWLPKLRLPLATSSQPIASAPPKSVAPRGVASEHGEVTRDETTQIKGEGVVTEVPQHSDGSSGVVPVTRTSAHPASSLAPPMEVSLGTASSTRTETGAPAPLAGNADALFREASAARTAGHIDQAIALFRELQQTYKGSPQAVMSHVSLGKLYMARGASNAAVEEFTAYLSSGGPLAEEALLGRAQALGAIGRSAEERKTWESLLAKYPQSVYAALAQERLRSLSHGSSN